MDLLSWNVAGLQAPEKLERLLCLLRTYPASIFLLQEAHLSMESLEYLKLLWKGSVFLSPDPTNPTGKAGVLTLVKEDPEITVTAHKEEIPGRLISIDVKWKDENFCIYNLYAPAEIPLQSAFFRKLPQAPENRLVIFGGDWNCLLAPLDRHGGSTMISNLSPSSLINYLRASSLVDIWRRNNPDTQDYTCFSVRLFEGENTLIASRLDRWHASDSDEKGSMPIICQTSQTNCRGVLPKCERHR